MRTTEIRIRLNGLIWPGREPGLRTDEATMKIGRAASLTGLSVKAIRHYEAVGLLGELDRDGAYRDLSPADVERLKLIARCRGQGFSVSEVREVIGLVDRAQPACPDAVSMLAVVQRRRDNLATEMSRLKHQDDELAVVQEYLESRLARGD